VLGNPGEISLDVVPVVAEAGGLHLVQSLPRIAVELCAQARALGLDGNRVGRGGAGVGHCVEAEALGFPGDHGGKAFRDPSQRSSGG
jgi:hypothetical protein